MGSKTERRVEKLWDSGAWELACICEAEPSCKLTHLLVKQALKNFEKLHAHLIGEDGGDWLSSSLAFFSGCDDFSVVVHQITGPSPRKNEICRCPISVKHGDCQKHLYNFGAPSCLILSVSHVSRAQVSGRRRCCLTLSPCLGALFATTIVAAPHHPQVWNTLLKTVPGQEASLEGVAKICKKIVTVPDTDEMDDGGPNENNNPAEAPVQETQNSVADTHPSANTLVAVSRHEWMEAKASQPDLPIWKVKELPSPQPHRRKLY